MKLLGINDDVTTCECCGKANLKCTVVLSSDDGMGQMHYGRDCAAKALSPRFPMSAIKVQRMAEKAAYQQAVEQRCSTSKYSRQLQGV